MTNGKNKMEHISKLIIWETSMDTTPKNDTSKNSNYFLVSINEKYQYY